MLDKKLKLLRRKVRIDRLKLQIEIMELERRVEQAYADGSTSLKPFIVEAEKMIAKGRDMLANTKIP
jgi:hypothetical protein